MVAHIDEKALLETTTVLQANQYPIKAVKLFQSSGNAEITRAFPLSFLRSEDGPKVVEIVHFPAGIQSLDVSVMSTSGNVTILDHYHASTTITDTHNFVSSNPTLRELEAERLRLEDEKRLRQQSFTFLTTWMDSLAQCKSHGQPEAAQMVTFFDEFVEVGITRSTTIAELDRKLADVGNRISEETERLKQLKGDLPVKIVAVLSCDGSVAVEGAELTVTYVVKQVSWKPAYDLHVSMAENIPSSTVTLHFRCKVTQWTGENWENVSLSLTTADQVSQLIQLPEPKRINISLGPTNAYTSTHAQSPAATRSTNMLGSQMRQIVVDEWSEHDLRGRERDRETPSARFGQQAQPTRSCAPAPPTPVANEAPKANSPFHTVSQLISRDSKDPITHVASGNIFIPSDHAEHHVLVASILLQAEFMRVVVPSVDTRVYYTCEVKNTSKYVLFPGTVKTYLNEKNVSSAEIHNIETPQVLECSLAVDSGMRTLRNRTPDAVPSVAPFTGKATTTYTSATVLHNTHAEAVRGVIVRSAIPLPADPRITIVLKEPVGLADIDEGSVVVKGGCLARWSTKGGRKGKQAGLFEWVCDMNPGTEVLKAVWEVCAPQDLKLLEQVR